MGVVVLPLLKLNNGRQNYTVQGKAEKAKSRKREM